MCVEVDLTKPVVGKVWLRGHWYQVQYEGLHRICSVCGCYGHLGRDCKQEKPSPPAVAAEVQGDATRVTTDPPAAVMEQGAIPAKSAPSSSNEINLVGGRSGCTAWRLAGCAT